MFRIVKILVKGLLPALLPLSPLFFLFGLRLYAV